MLLLRRAEELDIEKDTISGVLDSVLRVRGAGKTLAKQARVSAVHLSYIRRQRSMPRPRTARRIAKVLPLPAEQREAWLGHVERYWELREGTHREVGKILRDTCPKVAVDEIRHAHHAATSAADPARAGRRFLAVRQAGELLLHSFQPSRDPVHYVELGFVMHDVQCVLNRNDEALWHAKRVRTVIESMDARDYRNAREQISFFPVNAIRAEGVALHNLKLYRRAFDVFEQAEKVPQLKENEKFWRPYLNRDKINALAGMKRFPISLAVGLADQAMRICEARVEEQDSVLMLLISESLARAYIQHGNLRAAEKCLRAEYDRLSTISRLGPLPRVIFLRTVARLYWKLGDRRSEWKHFIGEAVRIGTQAGLEHQVDEMLREYGDPVKEMVQAAMGKLPRPKNARFRSGHQ